MTGKELLGVLAGIAEIYPEHMELPVILELPVERHKFEIAGVSLRHSPRSLSLLRQELEWENPARG